MTETDKSELETLKAQLANVESQLDAHDTAWEQDVKKLQRAEIQVRELRASCARAMDCLQEFAAHGDCICSDGDLCEVCNAVNICNDYAAALRSAAPSGPTMERPYDRLYVIEHMREGAWRLHMGMNMTIVYAAAQMRMHELQKEWGGEWRVTRYIPVQPCCKNGYPWERHDCEKTQAPFDKTNAGEERKDLAKVPAAHHTRWEGENPHNATVDSRSPRSAESASTQSGPQDSPSRSEWISVEERLPEVGEFVMVVIANVVQKMPANLTEEGWEWLDESADYAPKKVVTHWTKIPLFNPAPPSPAREKEKAE